MKWRTDGRKSAEGQKGKRAEGRKGGTAEWRNGGMAERWRGGTVEGRNGGTAEGRNGGTAEGQEGRIATATYRIYLIDLRYTDTETDDNDDGDVTLIIYSIEIRALVSHLRSSVKLP